MSTLADNTTTPGPRTAGRTGQPVELARYSATACGERILQGRRVDGVAILVDVPADPDSDGRVYLVERDLDLDGNHALQALIGDYLATSVQFGDCPMAASTS